MESHKYSLKDLIIYFLKLGTWGFGGPVALVEYMHRDLVVKKQWISEEEYREGLALAQLAPGPLAAQLGIYIGFVHYRLAGATLAGLAFVIPSFIMVVLIGMAYLKYSGLFWIQSVFYGVGACVVGIIALSAWKLTIKSVRKPQLKEVSQKWLLWILYFIALILTVVTEREEVMVFLASGFVYMLVKAPPAWIKKSLVVPVFVLTSIAGIQPEGNVLWDLAVFFIKAGTFVFGSGLAIVPFLHAGVVNEFKWLTEHQFLDAVAVAMVTPGPVVITVGFIGYLVAGFPGALIAALAVFLPCYLFTVILAPSFKRISKNISIRAFVDGITASVIGALAGAVIVIGIRTIVDIPAAAIAGLTVLSLIYIKKIKEPALILISAIIGVLIRMV